MRPSSANFSSGILFRSNPLDSSASLAASCSPASIASKIALPEAPKASVATDANIKLASVATDALGASGRAILEAMLAGEQDSARLAEMSKGLLRNKIPELKLALEGRMTEHHRFLLRQLFEHLRFTESKRSEIEQEID